jgi:hypothetical protein
MDENASWAFGPQSDRGPSLKFRGASITSVAGLLSRREEDESR